MVKQASEASARSRHFLDLDDLANAEPIPATEKMPDNLREMLTQQLGFFVHSETEPVLDFKPVAGIPGLWRVSESEQLQSTTAGKTQFAIESEHITELASSIVNTEGYRPPWADVEFLPRLAPFRLPGVRGNKVYHEPMRPRAEEAIRLSYPWCTVGKVFSTGGPTGPEGGSGVLVGPNLMLTASLVAPWGAGPGQWSMEFIPAFKNGDVNPRPFGSSFVSQFRGIRTEPEASGKDYVICRLYSPLGSALGWMGTQWWGNEDEYYNRRFQSSGYPDAFGGRPAVEFSIGIRDIDSDDPGLELEVGSHLQLSGGWSGGPLWFFTNEGPFVVGILSGFEKDELDPTRFVFAGGRHMVDLVKFGLANWP